MRILKNILVTGGAGFIGSNFIRFLLAQSDFSGRIVNLDLLTYAGNMESLDDVQQFHGGSRYFFEQGDICDGKRVKEIFSAYDIDTVVHLAAESHVDRSLHGPEAFVRTNVMGTIVLLMAAQNFWKEREGTLFHHVSTDEVFGSLGNEGSFYENQGGKRSSGKILLPQLRFSCHLEQLLQQLRSLSVPGKTDSPYDPEHD